MKPFDSLKCVTGSIMKEFTISFIQDLYVNATLLNSIKLNLEFSILSHQFKIFSRALSKGEYLAILYNSCRKRYVSSNSGSLLIQYSISV